MFDTPLRLSMSCYGSDPAGYIVFHHRVLLYAEMIPAPTTVVGHSQMAGRRCTGILACRTPTLIFAGIVLKPLCYCGVVRKHPKQLRTVIFFWNIVPDVWFISQCGDCINLLLYIIILLYVAVGHTLPCDIPTIIWVHYDKVQWQLGMQSSRIPLFLQRSI